MALVTFLSDYGLQDEFVGVCHGVIAMLAPGTQVIDVTHGVPRHDVRTGALTLRHALPFCPPGVHLAIVDPEVGPSARRAVAVAVGAGDRVLLGPDNGLLMPAAEALGGAVEAVDVGLSPFRLEPVSATFHGRDLFAPVAAALARGEPLGAAGEPIAADQLLPLALPEAIVEDGGVRAHALHTDGFGNVMLDATHEQLIAAGLRLGAPVSVQSRHTEHPARFVKAFVDVPEGALLLYEDARRMAALAVNRGSAASLLGVRRDGEIVLRAG
jgi:S-adenosyl-L-methionine hydrolase (adenosine-forming)